MLGIWDRAAPLVERATRETGIAVRVIEVTDLTDGSAGEALSGIDLLYVLNIAADKVEPLRQTLEQAKRSNPSLRIVALDRRGSHASLQSAELIEYDDEVRAYWRSNGLQNMRRLLVYSQVAYLGGDGEIQPAVQVPDSGYYIPEKPEEAATDLAQVKSQASWIEGGPVAVILIHQSFWITQDTKVIDAEIEALRRRGVNCVALFAATQEKLQEMLTAAEPDLMIEDRHAGTWETAEGKNFLRELDVPYLRPISMLGYTTQQWLDDPQGLHPRDIGSFMSLQELNGTIEPIVVGGLKASVSGFRLHEPIPERVERFADRALRWLGLREKANADKRLAIVYYSKSLGKDDLLRGSPTGAFLDGPESLVRFLPRLNEAGYELGAEVPQAKEALLSLALRQGRNIGPWAQGELDALADQPGVELIPLDTYQRWFDTKLDEAHRRAVIDKHGPPPGKLMTVTRNGESYIVLPAIHLGNIVLMPQPERGEKQDETLLHSRDVPPPHNYLACYWWLQEGFRADAITHWGTHGTLELQPGKETGLSADDWSDLCVGTMPVVNLWIMDNIGESTLSRRRSYALLVDHLPPPAVSVAAADETAKLHDDMGKYYTLETGVLKEEYRKRISAAATEQRFTDLLQLTADASGMLNDASLSKLHEHLHVVTESRTPTSLHILGEKIDREKLPGYLTSILGSEFIGRVNAAIAHEAIHTHDHDADHAHHTASHTHADWDARDAAEHLIDHAVLEGQEPPAMLRDDIATARELVARLDQTDDEIVNLLRGFEGRFVSGGPGPDPIRNPASAPSGRNLYALNPQEIPTQAAWSVGKQLVEQMLAEKEGIHKVGMDLNGMNTMRDFGVMEAQILYLMGVRPVWDANRLCIDVELIPSEELGRPRVDVFIAMGGQYKENFRSRVALLDKAVRLVSRLDEPGNGVHDGTERMRRTLLDRGFSAEQADMLAPARIFGTKPGNLSGTNILYLVPRSGVWESDDEIADVYIDSMSYVYTGEVWGEQVDGLYQEAIQRTDTLVRVWASNMTSQLSNHHAYEYLGGLSMAVTKLTGNEPRALIADVRDPSGARIRDFEEVLDTTLRSELLNTDWIKGMKAHDYAGAGQIAELVKNTFGWDVTRDSAVSGEVWNEIYETYIQDQRDLGLEQWFEQVNPHARQVIAATMMEAARKGYWNASEQQLEKLAALYAESVAVHGPSNGLVAGGNRKLDDAVTEHLQAPGRQQLAQRYANAVAEASGESPGDAKVYGAKLQEVDQAADAAPPVGEAVRWVGAALATFILLAVGFGVWKRVGTSA